MSLALTPKEPSKSLSARVSDVLVDLSSRLVDCHTNGVAGIREWTDFRNRIKEAIQDRVTEIALFSLVIHAMLLLTSREHAPANWPILLVEVILSLASLYREEGQTREELADGRAQCKSILSAPNEK